MIDKILIANRGEIACRVVRTARALGYRTVAVFSDADADAPHVQQADEAVHIGASPAAESYLNIAALLDAARRTGADAVHPGYGFLSENAAFAQACGDAGIVFIGPPPSAITAMGDKALAKQRMIAAGVPCAPGYLGAEQGDDHLAREAAALGFPLLVKAVAGGGGRGMRLVREEAEMIAAIAGARREALSAFGDGTLMLERLIEGGRHIEIQVFADTHGNAIHLGERDCTAQRRRQKVIEESPSPVVSAAMREAMGRDAVAAALAVGYVGAGTVEFIVDAELKPLLPGDEHAAAGRASGDGVRDWVRPRRMATARSRRASHCRCSSTRSACRATRSRRGFMRRTPMRGRRRSPPRPGAFSIGGPKSRHRSPACASTTALPRAVRCRPTMTRWSPS